jgi:hypothetical protein
MMTKGKIYGCIARLRGTESTLRQKIQQCCWIFELQTAGEDQLPNQFAQGMRLRMSTKPTAYSM